MIETGKSRTANTLINTSMGIIVRALSLIMSFGLRTVFIRTLGIQYTGVSSLFTDILTVLSLAELGIGSAITYALYRPLADQDERQIAVLMRFFKKAYRIVAAAIVCGGLCLIPFLDSIITDVPDISENTTVIYTLFLLNTAVSYLLIYKATLLTASQRRYIVSKVEIYVSVIKTAVQCILLFATHNYILYLAVTILATAMQNIIISKRVNREYPFLSRYHETIDRDESRTILKDVRALAMYQISGVVLNGTDSIIISAAINTVSVGLLSNYKLIVKSVDNIIRQFYVAVEPSIGNLAVNSDDEYQFHTFLTTQFVTFWISCFCSVSFITLCDPFVNLWLGREYVVSRGIVFALVADFYVTMMVRAVASFRTSNGLFVQGKYRPVIMAFLNVVLSILLANTNGVFGVLIATVISRAATQVWYDPWLVYRRVFHKPVRHYIKLYTEYLAVTVACCVATYYLGQIIAPGDGYISLLIKIFLCIAIPNLTVCLLYRRIDEFKKVLKVAARILEKWREHINGMKRS